jgi:hypothetical protein
LAKQHTGPASISTACSALRSLEKPDLVRLLAPVQQPRKAPVVLAQDWATASRLASPQT